MLSLVATKTSITADCSTVVITDSTGSVSATGYGVGGNQARATLALKVCLSLRKSTGRETIAIDAYNEFTASTWSVTVTEDGWYEIYFFGCLAWSGATTYAQYEIVYDATTDAFYKSAQAANTNHAVTDTAWWTATTDVEDFATAVALPQTSTYQTTTNYIELCRTRKCEAAMLVAAGCDCNNSTTDQLQQYEKVRMKMEAATIQAADSNYTEAQEIIENLQAICENEVDCGCS